MGQGYGVALGFAALQAVAFGVLAWSALRVSAVPRARFLGPAASAMLLLALFAGALHAPAFGLLAAAGLSHALLYSVLLLVFAATLRPGRVALVTTLARRLNPHFHAGMVPYTRGVTGAWCLFFAGQLLLSLVLAVLRPALWATFVTSLHAPLVLVMAAAEFAVRSWRWRHGHYTGWRDTLAGMRRLSRPAALPGAPAADGTPTAARTSRPA